MLAFLAANPWTTAAGAAILLAALAGLVYALVRRPGDPGFLRRGGVELRWDRAFLPLDLFVSPDLPGEVYPALESARAELNDAVGREALSPPLDWRLDREPVGATAALVYVRPRDPGLGAGGTTEHRYDLRTGRILSATVSIAPGTPLLERVVLHELGHALGLDDDGERGSVMFPVASEQRSGRLSARDRAALRRVYG